MAQVLTFRIPERIEFRHSFFTTFPDAQFRIGANDDVPVMTFEMGDQKTALPLPGVKREFKIPEYSDDGVMLNTVTRSLNYVTILKIGDPVPGEVLTGKSSWTPTKEDHAAATQRVTSELVGWNLAVEVPRSHPGKMRQFAEQYVDEETTRYALLRLAAHFGMGSDGAERLAKVLDDIAQEVAYIETLRGRCGEVNGLGRKLVGMQKTFAHQASVMSDLEPVARIFKEPVRLFRDEFAELDNKLSEVVTVFGDLPSLKTIMRRGRDQLLRRLAPWKEITESWARMGADATDPFAVVPYLRDLYRFMAPRYVPADEWELMLSQNNLDAAAGPQGKVVTWFERDPKVA